MKNSYDNREQAGIASAILSFASDLKEGAKLQDCVIPVAHPMNCGIDGCSGRIAGKNDGRWFQLKVLSEDQKGWINYDNALAMSSAAGLAGFAPRLHASDRASAAFLFEALGTDWRFALVQDFRKTEVRVDALRLTKRLHGLELLPQTISIFSRIIELQQIMESPIPDPLTGAPVSVELPDGYSMMRDWMARISQAFEASGYDLVPCHVENSLSNVMIRQSGEMKLVDFDRAANADPFSDIGALCNVYSRTEEDITQAVEIYCGTPSPDAVARTKLHMIVAVFHWGLWGVVSHQLSPRRDIEYYKYGQNQFIRCAANLSQWEPDALIRNM